MQQFSSEENIFDAQFEQLEQISWRPAANYAEHLVDGNDINSQLSAAGRFFLGSDSLTSPDSVADLVAGELCNVLGPADVGLNSKVVLVKKENGIDYTSTINIHGRNNAYSSDSLGLLYSDQGQHATSLAPEPCLTATQKLLFRIREISPEWSFSFESTKVCALKVIIINDLLSHHVFQFFFSLQLSGYRIFKSIGCEFLKALGIPNTRGSHQYGFREWCFMKYFPSI